MWPWKSKRKKRQGAAGQSDVREFIRHTVDVPLEFSTVRADDADDLGHFDPGPASPREPEDTRSAHSVNVGFGGLAFHSNYCPAVGELIELRIPSVDPPFVAKARVAWCRPEDGNYLIGASFQDASDAFRSRMVQQVCSIESYRKEVREKEGRDLTTEQASAEWIAKFAGRFPGDGGPSGT